MARTSGPGCFARGAAKRTGRPGADLKWVDFWDNRADANREAIKKEQKLPNDERIQILKWMPQSDADLYLRDLEIRTTNLRKKALTTILKIARLSKRPRFHGR